jgi:hypothetical protein
VAVEVVATVSVPIPALREKITSTAVLETAYNRKKLGPDMCRRIVNLACGHMAITRNQRVARCARCEEMLRRSVADGREDYDSFRKGKIRDTMEWPDDPCRTFNEENIEL